MYCYYVARSEGRAYTQRLEKYVKQRNQENAKVMKFNGNTLITQCTRRYIENGRIITKQRDREDYERMKKDCPRSYFYRTKAKKNRRTVGKHVPIMKSFKIEGNVELGPVEESSKKNSN